MNSRTPSVFSQVHRRLTLLFGGITGSVLLVMTLLCLYVAESALYDNSFAAFERDASSLTSALEQQDNLTRSWLSQTQDDGKYILYLFDNDVPLAYTAWNASSDALLREIQAYADARPADRPAGDGSRTSHTEFSYTDKSGQRYFVCLARIPKTNGRLTMLLLSPLTGLHRQIVRQRLLFLIIVTGTILSLFFFCRWFTALLLRPIEESQRRQVQFVASASHELRTPLTVLTNCLSALRRPDAAGRDGFIQIMEKEVFRMARLLTDMLTLAGADSGRFQIQRAPTELDTLLLDSFEAFELPAHEKGIALSVRLPEESLPPCLCDRDRISQALAVLIQNALSYHRTDGDGRFVALSLEADGHWFQLAVTDNGPGIPDSEKESVFERFYRCDVSRRQKDHFGLGLSIAGEIIAAHGGRIRLRDTEGGGASFTIWLPATSDSPS